MVVIGVPKRFFQSLKGIESVEQGYVSSNGGNKIFSEAVIVNFNADCINLKALIEIHLHTHKSTSDHSMRKKYSSAVYYFSEVQQKEVKTIIVNLNKDLNKDLNNKLIIKILPFVAFKASRE